VDEKLVPVAGSTRERLPNAKEIGPVDENSSFTVTVYVRPNPNAPAIPDPTDEALKKPRERQYLTPDQVQSSFGADPADLQKVADFAKGRGLTIVDENPTARSIRLQGTAKALSAAFGVKLRTWHHQDPTTGKTYEFRGRLGNVLVPESLQPIVEGVFGFDNRRVGEKLYVKYPPGHWQRPMDKASAAQLPSNTYLPPQVSTLYDFPSSADGTGQTIAVLVFNGQIGTTGESALGGYDPTVLNRYFTNVLGRQAGPNITDVVVHGPGNQPGDGSDPNDVTSEVYLDLCLVGALAPGAKIAVYFTEFTEQGWVDAITHAVADTANNPSVISISYGNPEDDPTRSLWTESAVQVVNTAFQAAAAAGRTICCASGDDGSGDEPGTRTVHVDFPASSPWVLGCGGTRLESSNGAITSEVVWNDLNIGKGATGGGISVLFPVPTWQAKVNKIPLHSTTNTKGRGVPDVSSLADPETPFAVAGPGGSLDRVGGTSASAPLWAALTACLNQALGARVGFVNPYLYTHCATGVLRDISQGNNGAYRAKQGWDPCTGLGSPSGAKLLQALR
jgi:kumamolisin